MCIQKDKSSHFHFAVNGKSFAVIRNEHKDLLYKVNNKQAWFSLFLNKISGYVKSVLIV